MNHNRPGWFRRHPILTAVLAIFVFVIVVSSMSGTNTTSQTSAATTPNTQPATTPLPPATPTQVTAKQLGDAFEANQVAAEKKWGGQLVQFTAPVSNINSGSVSFQNVTTKFSFTQISCRVADETALLGLVKGQKATVRGVVGDDQLLGVISLNDCEIVR